MYYVRYFSHFGLRIQQLGSTPSKGRHFGAKTSQTTWFGSTPFISGSGFSNRIDHHFVLFILVFCVNKVTQKLDFGMSTSLIIHAHQHKKCTKFVYTSPVLWCLSSLKVGGQIIKLEQERIPRIA